MNFHRSPVLGENVTSFGEGIEVIIFLYKKVNRRVMG